MRNRSTSSSKFTNNSISLHHTSNRYHRTSPIAPSKARKTNAALSASAQVSQIFKFISKKLVDSIIIGNCQVLF